MAEHPFGLTLAAERGMRFEAMRAAIAATPPELMASYEAETNEWLDADLGVPD